MLNCGDGSCEVSGFAETELRLGVGPDRSNAASSYGKRRYADAVDLKLNLSPKEANLDRHDVGEKSSDVQEKSCSVNPPAKAQAVGWPPVRSFRKNFMAVHQRSTAEESGDAAAFVKVSMDGAPYLRKVDLKLYKTYQELSEVLTTMFSSFTTGKCDSQGTVDFMNESKVIDLVNGSEYVPTYEDRDGDWMLVGDVPWEMFVGSCKRLRIMRGAEAKGLAPRAMEKCKNRS